MWKRSIAYEDFELHVGPEHEGGYPVVVIASPAGGGHGTFRVPFTAGELAAVAAVPIAGRGAGLPGMAPRLGPEEVGRRLFEALIKGDVRDRWIASRHQAEDGLRLRLRLSPGPGFGTLHSLPWELLFDPDQRSFLALSRRTPVVRQLEIAGSISRPPPLPNPLRLLVLSAQASDHVPLRLADELDGLRRPWRREVDVVPLNADREALREHLLDLARPIHFLHFQGHGAFDERKGTGVLYFADAEGRALSVAAGDFAAELDASKLRLVFLNACDTARAGGAPGDGIATALLLGGTPALVAMQAPISDAAAVAFSAAIYRRLAAGDPLEAAVSEGRLAIQRLPRSPAVGSPSELDTAEWAIPVLYLRGPDGWLFDPSMTEPAMPWTWPDLAAIGAGTAATAGLAGLLPLHLLDSLPMALGSSSAAVFGTAALAVGSLRQVRASGLLPTLGRHIRWSCAAALLAVTTAWATQGAGRLCALRCDPLGCSDLQRVVIAELSDRSPQPSVRSAQWAQETRGVLADKLRLAGFQVLGGGVAPAQRCVDFRITGSVAERGPEVSLNAEVVDERGASRPRVQATAPLDAAGTALPAQGLLARGVLDVLGARLTRRQEQAVLDTPTRHPEALRLNNLGVVERALGQRDQAAARFEAALALDPEYASAWSNLGMIQLDRHQPRAAAQSFTRAIELFPHNPTYRLNLGLAFQEAGRPQEAVDAYRQALKLDPSDARVHNNLGDALREVGDLAGARRSLRLGLGFALDDATRAAIRTNLGQVELAAGRPAEAAVQLTAALELWPAFAEAWIELARARERLKDPFGACAALARYRSLPVPDDRDRRRVADQLATRLACPVGGEQ